MRILWTVANWKRTGPLEPSLDLAAAVARRGHDVRVAVGRAPRGGEPSAVAARAARGLEPAGLHARLRKHAFFLLDWIDRARLGRWLEAHRPDLAVTTLGNDHRIVLAATGPRAEPPVVRLWFHDGREAPRARERAALSASHAVAAFGETPRRRLVEAGVDEAHVLRLDPPLDLVGLRALAAEGLAVRERHGVPPDAFCLGIVARLQRHRRFDLLWQAAARLREAALSFRILVIGRGTHAEEVARRPVRDAGLGGQILFTGYLQGAAYASALRALDAQVLLVPGSDPTCRALREGMALGIPSLATRRGLLPDLVADGETGFLVDEDPDALAAAALRLAADRSLAGRMGAAACHRAETRFDAARVAEAFLEGLAAIPHP